MEERTILCYNFFEGVRKRLSSEKYTFRNWAFSFWEKPKFLLQTGAECAIIHPAAMLL